MENLQEGNTYLFKYGTEGRILLSMTVLMITEKAYYIRTNTGKNSIDEWIDKSTFEKDYTFFEDITARINQPKGKELDELNNRIKLVPCYVCKGKGIIFDGTTTGGSPCPACFGNRVVVGSIQLDTLA
jgi:hypothetical protein